MRPFNRLQVRTAFLTAPVVLLFAASCAKHDEHAGHNHAGHDHSTESKSAAPATPSKHGHAHLPPHGGTPVILGDEVFHLEFVHARARGVLQSFILDGHMESFIRSAAPSFEVIATVGGEKRVLLFKPVTDSATGEKPGDASLFEAEAEWLKTAETFDAVLVSLDIRGAVFGNIAFKFPASS